MLESIKNVNNNWIHIRNHKNRLKRYTYTKSSNILEPLNSYKCRRWEIAICIKMIIPIVQKTPSSMKMKHDKSWNIPTCIKMKKCIYIYIYILIDFSVAANSHVTESELRKDRKRTPATTTTHRERPTNENERHQPKAMSQPATPNKTTARDLVCLASLFNVTWSIGPRAHSTMEIRPTYASGFWRWLKE